MFLPPELQEHLHLNRKKKHRKLCDKQTHTICDKKQDCYQHPSAGKRLYYKWMIISTPTEQAWLRTTVNADNGDKISFYSEGLVRRER